MPCCPISTYFNSNNFIFLLCHNLRCYDRIFIDIFLGLQPLSPFRWRKPTDTAPRCGRYIYLRRSGISKSKNGLVVWLRAQSSSQSDHYSDDCLRLLYTLYLCSRYRGIPSTLNFLCTPRQCLRSLLKLLDLNCQFPVISKVLNSCGCFWEFFIG